MYHKTFPEIALKLEENERNRRVSVSKAVFAHFSVSKNISKYFAQFFRGIVYLLSIKNMSLTQLASF